MTGLHFLSRMDNVQKPPTTVSSVRVKAPRRILHFSDGTLEEYSTDDETDAPNYQISNEDNRIDVVI